MQNSLYFQQKIQNELDSLVIQLQENNQSLTIEHLLTIDQMHYYDTQALKTAAVKLEFPTGDESKKSLLDIGSGYGGSARYFSNNYHLQTIALELQPKIHQIGQQMTSLVKDLNQSDILNKKLYHLEGNILNPKLFNQIKEKSILLPDQNQMIKHSLYVQINRLKPMGYDYLTSFLVFLHIPYKLRFQLFKTCYQLLKPGGKLYIEDYYQRKPLYPNECIILQQSVSCTDIPSMKDYLFQLKEVGFVIDLVEDLSEDYRKFTTARYYNYQQKEQKERELQIHGYGLVANMLHFYQCTAMLFQNGRLGGIRIIACKP